MGYSPWGRKESDTTEQLHFLSIYIYIHTHTHTHTHTYAYLHLYLYITSSDQNKPNFKQEIINSGQIGLNVLI